MHCIIFHLRCTFFVCLQINAFKRKIILLFFRCCNNLTWCIFATDTRIYTVALSLNYCCGIRYNYWCRLHVSLSFRKLYYSCAVYISNGFNAFKRKHIIDSALQYLHGISSQLSGNFYLFHETRFFVFTNFILRNIVTFTRDVMKYLNY